MTTYTQSSRLKIVEGFLKDAPWFKGQVIGKSGTFGAPRLYNRDKHIQLDKIIATAANIKKGLEKEFPSVPKSELKNFLRTAVWFNGLLELTESQHDDLLAGEPQTVEEIRGQIDSVNYKYDQDLEDWFVGYSTTFTSDPDYTKFWMPWFTAQATSGSSINKPADMNGKVTNIAGDTGTSGTIMDMTTVLTSTTTNQTIDFVGKTFRPIIRAFTEFKDANNGRRMVDTRNQYGTTARFTLLVDPPVIDELDGTHPYDGSQIDYKQSIGEMIRKLNIEIVPCEDFTSSFAEDGTIQFGFVADFPRNFKKGIVNKMKWDAWKEIPDVNSKWVKKMTSRLVPFTMPYYDGTNFYKAFFHGSFVYKNDAA